MTDPFDRDMERDAEKKSDRPERFESRLITLQPTKDGTVGDNKLFFNMFAPAAFGPLAKWPIDAKTWYLKFYVHYVDVEDEESGSKRRVPVLCEPSMNSYAKERLTQPDMVFPEPFPTAKSCAFCDQSQKFWDEYQEKKIAAGIQNLSVDEFKARIQKEPELTELRNLARAWGAIERVYYTVLDYAKYAGEKGNEGGEPVRLSGLFTGIGVLRDLYRERKSGYKFYEPTGNCAIVRITRDNTRGARYAKYDIRCLNEPAHFDDDTLGYLASGEDVPDPFTAVLKIWEPGQKSAYVNAHPLTPTDDIASEPTITVVKDPKSTVTPRPRVMPIVHNTVVVSSPAVAAAAAAPTATSPKREKTDLRLWRSEVSKAFEP